MSAVRQQALTLTAPVTPGQEQAVDGWLRANKRALQRALVQSSTTHFARWVLLPPSRGEDGELVGERTLLAFESNFDGELAEHVADLRVALGELLDAAFEHAEGYPGRADGEALLAFFRSSSRRTAAFFVAHGGLSVPRVRGDAALRGALEEHLQQRAQGARVRAASGVELVRELQRVALAVATERGVTLGTVDRGLEPKPGLMATVFTRPLGLLLAFLLAPFFERRDALVRRRQSSLLTLEQQRKRDEIGLEEDRVDQNGLTHLVPLKPGWYRAFALKMMVLLVTAKADAGALVGSLGGIRTIHFARWVVLPDRRLLFLSNYDGSWEAYLGDFIDKASMGLTMIWCNTACFPKTRLLLFQGARDEGAFKAWTRAYQVPTQVWYSAYPLLSVTDVLKNARIRELLGQTASPAQARELLALL